MTTIQERVSWVSTCKTMIVTTRAAISWLAAHFLNGSCSNGQNVFVATGMVFSSSLLEHMPSFTFNSVEEDEEDTLPVSSGNNSFLGFPTNLNIGTPRYQCHSCEQPDCSEETICHNAYQVFMQITVSCKYGAKWFISIMQCWKSRVRDTNGMELVSKGCTTNPDQVVLYCNTLSFDGTANNQRESSLFSIECCVGDFCNNGTFPALPTTSYSGDFFISSFLT